MLTETSHFLTHQLPGDEMPYLTYTHGHRLKVCGDWARNCHNVAAGTGRRKRVHTLDANLKIWGFRVSDWLFPHHGSLPEISVPNFPLPLLISIFRGLLILGLQHASMT